MKMCLSCFHEYDETFGVCPYCGTTEVKQTEPIDLLPGTILTERFIIGKSIGAGGFGIIYKGWDDKLKRIVAVKEYYPSQLVARAAGTTNLIVNSKSQAEFDYRKRRFLVEAKNMAKFSAHKNIPNIIDFFEENGTAYIVMELLEGTALDDYLDENEKLPIDLAVHVANEVGKALISLHENKIIHRDVAPDNIFLCSGSTLRVKLLDLGAAKLGADEEDVIDIIMKPGYSPVEQYVDDKVKETSVDNRADIYGLGASLYHMLTGVKPDEATNRKDDKDIVVNPRDLNPDISENLSNAVMKAMAIDRHMRFKNVDEFLKAINGEKKVVSLKKEKKRRKIKQIVGIAAAVLLVAFGALFVSKYYNNERLKVELNPASIDVWFSVKEGSNELAAMESIKSDFEGSFEGVVVNLRAIPADEYNTELLSAYNSGTMPDLYESSFVSDKIISDSMDLSEIMASEQAEDCLFFYDYEDCYPDAKQIPLSIEVPVVCVVTRGYTQLEYEGDTFNGLSSLATDIVAIDYSATEILNENFDIGTCVNEECFMNNETNLSAVYLTTTLGINEVRQTLTNYQKTFVYCSDKTVDCKYINEWSVFDGGDDDEVNAAKRLLTWMLGNAYQNTLMVSICSEGQIPVCEECFNVKASQENFEGLASTYSNFRFSVYDDDPSQIDASELNMFENNTDDLIDMRSVLVRSLYLNVLQREPGQSEIDYWVGCFETSSIEESLGYILNSAEAAEKNLALSEYVRIMYQIIDAEDSVAYSNWLSRLETEELSLGDFLHEFFASEEWISYVNNVLN